MIRASLALMVLVVLSAVLGSIVLLLGLVYPSRQVMAWAGRLWAQGLLWICGVRLRIEGHEGLDDGRPRFFVGNHQSALDIPVIMAALRGDVRFMAKDTLFRIPVFGWVLFQYGFVPINRDNARKAHRALERMMVRLRTSPISFAAFPEGTRSRDGNLLPFRKGTLKICQRAGMPVVPFSIDGTIAVHHRDDFFRARPGMVRLTFGNPITAAEVSEASASELHERVRSTVLRQLGRSAEVPRETAVPLVATEGT